MSAQQRSWVYDLLPALCMDLAFYFTLLSVQHRLYEVGTPPERLALTLTAYTASYVVSCLIVGRFAARRPFTAMLLGLGLVQGLLLVMAQAASLESYALLLGVYGFAAALWWAPLQAVVSMDGAAELRSKRLGNFNLGWTLGKGAGLLASGLLFDEQNEPSALAFYLSAGLTALTMVIIALRARSSPARSVRPAEADLPGALSAGAQVPGWRLHFGSALLANMLCWGGHSAIIALIPVLGEGLALSPGKQGALLAAMVGAQALTFGALRRWESWLYRPGAVVGAILLAGLGLILLSWAGGFVLALLAFGSFGAAVGLSYAASLRYALDGPGQPMRYASIHEANLGFGALIIPYLFGLAIARYGASTAALCLGLLAFATASALVLAMAFQECHRQEPRAAKS